MKEMRMKVLGTAVFSAIAAVAISFAGGCKSKPVQENPTLPAPAMQPAPVTAPAANLAPAPLPATPAIPAVPAEPVKYTVEKGDSFSKIAKKYGVGMKELAAYNNMSLEKPLRIGVTLKIPPKAAK